MKADIEITEMLRTILKKIDSDEEITTEEAEFVKSNLQWDCQTKQGQKPKDGKISLRFPNETLKVFAAMPPTTLKKLCKRFGTELSEYEQNYMKSLSTKDLEEQIQKGREIEARALSKLRHPIRSKRIRSF